MSVDLDSVPLVGRAYRLGVSRVTTTLVLLGPVVIAVAAVLGRSPATIVVGVAYVLSLPTSVAYFWATGSDPEDDGERDGGDGDEGSEVGDGSDGGESEDDESDGGESEDDESEDR